MVIHIKINRKKSQTSIDPKGVEFISAFRTQTNKPSDPNCVCAPPLQI